MYCSNFLNISVYTDKKFWFLFLVTQISGDAFWTLKTFGKHIFILKQDGRDGKAGGAQQDTGNQIGRICSDKGAPCEEHAKKQFTLLNTCSN